MTKRVWPRTYSSTQLTALQKVLDRFKEYER